MASQHYGKIVFTLYLIYTFKPYIHTYVLCCVYIALYFTTYNVYMECTYIAIHRTCKWGLYMTVMQIYGKYNFLCSATLKKITYY